MNKRVFIVHGWDGHPEGIWFPWLKKELEGRGFQVFVPQLPDTAEPRIKKWVPALQKAVNEVDENTYFIGHSMGCQTITRLLENLSENEKAGGAVFVAGFFKRLTNLENNEIERSVADEWLTTPLDLLKVKSHLLKSVAIFSDNDPYVPVDNQDDFKEKLGSEIIMEHEKGHFSSSTGTVELETALNALLKIAQ